MNSVPVAGIAMSPGTAMRFWDREAPASDCRDAKCEAEVSSGKWFTLTFAPWERYSRAMARPMPVQPPVMAAILPARRVVIVL